MMRNAQDNEACDKCAPRCDATCPTKAMADLRRIASEQEATNRDALLRLRALRLWHYRQLLQARRNAQTVASALRARAYNAEASTHLGFVQSLNDFFEIGDTAERDDNREDAA